MVALQNSTKILFVLFLVTFLYPDGINAEHKKVLTNKKIPSWVIPYSRSDIKQLSKHNDGMISHHYLFDRQIFIGKSTSSFINIIRQPLEGC